MVLASEGHCLCGVDVAAPQQLRRGPQQPVLDYLQSFRKQFTAHEVRGRQPRRCSCSMSCVRMCRGRWDLSRGWNSHKWRCMESASLAKQRKMW